MAFPTPPHALDVNLVPAHVNWTVLCHWAFAQAVPPPGTAANLLWLQLRLSSENPDLTLQVWVKPPPSSSWVSSSLVSCIVMVTHGKTGLPMGAELASSVLHQFCDHDTVLSSVQLLSRVQLFVTPRTAARQASLSITNSWSLLKLMFIELVMPSNHLILCRPLLLLPSIFPSSRVFSNESVLCIRWPKYWSFSFSISHSIEYSELISFRMDWLDLLAVQGTLKSLLQHHSSKASILWCSAFFILQLSHPYMTTGKTVALTWLSVLWQY